MLSAIDGVRSRIDLMAFVLLEEHASDLLDFNHILVLELMLEAFNQFHDCVTIFRADALDHDFCNLFRILLHDLERLTEISQDSCRAPLHGGQDERNTCLSAEGIHIDDFILLESRRRLRHDNNLERLLALCRLMLEIVQNCLAWR